MSTMNISLPDPMRAFVEEQVKQKGYSTASEYIRHLIRTEQENVESKRIEALLLEGLDSGEKIEITDEWWEKKKEELTQRLSEDKS
ncbi:MAG: type II toxin-antitoxin system ParD family antitoxin [Mastigocoleus sp.]